MKTDEKHLRLYFVLEYCRTLSLQELTETEALVVSFSFTSAGLGASPRGDAGETPWFLIAFECFLKGFELFFQRFEQVLRL